MKKQKIEIESLIRKSTPMDKKLKLTPNQTEKLKTVGAVALMIAGVAGVVALTAIAPNIFVAIDKMFLKKYNRKLSKKEKDVKIAQAFYYLKRSGHIKMKITKSDVKIYLTRLGKRKIMKLEIESLVIEKPKSWDRKWWLVAADIPTKKYKRGADLLREKLRELGFYFLQRTFWVYPFDPRQEIEFITNYYGIGRFVTVMEINRLDLDDERNLKHYFRSQNLLK